MKELQADLGLIDSQGPDADVKRQQRRRGPAGTASGAGTYTNLPQIEEGDEEGPADFENGPFTEGLNSINLVS